jgi:hypothetical protein
LISDKIKGTSALDAAVIEGALAWIIGFYHVGGLGPIVR